MEQTDYHLKKIFDLIKNVDNFTVINELTMEESLIGEPKEEENTEDITDDLTILDKIQLWELPETSNIDIRYFMDGIQRTFHVGYFFNSEFNYILPINYYIVGAVILERENRDLKVFNEIIDSKFIIPPKDLLSDTILDLLEGSFIEISKADFDFFQVEKLRSVMNNYASRERLRLERRIVNEFNKHNIDEWMIVDGALTEKEMFSNKEFMDSTKKIGLIKRQVRKFFTPKLEFDMLKLFHNNRDMKTNKRSWKFQFKRRINGDNIPILSCYTKLFFDNPDPYFSLIRVETFKEYESEFEAIVRAIREENYPSSFPSDVYDKKIYPIKMCEEHLRGRIPSVKFLKSVFTNWKSHVK